MPPTRGQRLLQQYLSNDEVSRGDAKHRAALMSPGLPLRSEGKTQPFTPHPDVLTFLRSRVPSTASTALSHQQAEAVRSLSGTASAGGTPSLPLIRRLRLSTVPQVTDVLALAALQRAAQTDPTLPTPPPGRAVLVLVEEEADGKSVVAAARERYGVAVVEITTPSPTLPQTKKGTPKKAAGKGRTTTNAPLKKGAKTLSPSSSSAAGKSSPLETEGGDVVEGTDISPPTTAAADADDAAELGQRSLLMVASLSHFLAVRKASVMWAAVGVCVLCSGSFSAGKRSTPSVVVAEAEALAAKRWECLGHVSVVGVVGATAEDVTAERVCWLTAPKGEAGGAAANGNSHSTQTRSAASSSKDSIDVKSAPAQKAVVHYAVVEGTARLSFLLSLLTALRPGHGLVVHCSTTPLCAFLFDVLYALRIVPSHVKLLADFEGESAFSPVRTPEERARLVNHFDDILLPFASTSGAATVAATQDGGFTSVVLLSAFGLVPTRGTTFVQYDTIVDLTHYSQFLRTRLLSMQEGDDALSSPAAGSFSSSSEKPVGKTAARAAGARVAAAQKRGRVAATATLATSTTSTPSANAPPTDGSPSYQHVIILLRRPEVTAVVAHLQRTTAANQLSYTALPRLPSLTQHLFSIRKVQSMHAKVFAIQNAAYAAYRATMLLYSTVGPSSVYAVDKLNLQTVMEEFGYQTVPLLDLRTKDTVYRPKEDVYKAAKKKQRAEERVWKRFADAHIIGEGPQKHVVDEMNEE